MGTVRTETDGKTGGQLPASAVSPSGAIIRTSRVPVSTYRVQLTPDFGFAAVTGIAGYLADLGVPHAYLSPILQPTPGSTHAYAVTDHSPILTHLPRSA